jgi:hypothetical protein
MSNATATVKIVSTDKSTQGDFVVINEFDFDEKTMKLYKEKPLKKESVTEQKEE